VCRSEGRRIKWSLGKTVSLWAGRDGERDLEGGDTLRASEIGFAHGRSFFFFFA
jgi:hypothetical protein